MVLKYCKNKPTFIVDKGVWYKDAFKRMGFNYENETFGRRNAVEQFFIAQIKNKKILQHIPRK